MRAVLDTGAEATFVRAAVARQLRLHALQGRSVVVATGERSFRGRFSAEIQITEDFIWQGAILEGDPSGVDLILGRDFLERCVLTYDGPEHAFTLEWN